MRPAFVALVLMALAAVTLAACSDRGEQKRQLEAQIQDNITLTDKNLQALKRAHDLKKARLERLSGLAAQMDLEIEIKQGRIAAARSGTASLRELVNFGFGETPGEYIVRNPAFSLNVYLYIIFGVMAVWLLYRLRQQSIEQQMLLQIDNVIQRLSEEASQVAKVQASPPATPKSEPEPEPEPEPGPEPEPEPEPGPEPGPEPEPPKPSSAPAKAKAPPRKSSSAKSAKEKPAKSPVRKKPANRPAGKKCRVKGCNNKHRSKGFCNKHYQQWRKGILTEPVEDE